MAIRARTRRASARVLGVVVAAVLTVAATALPAGAHADFVSSTPRAGSTVQQLPGSVTLTFSEPVRTPAFVEVTAPGGENVAVGDVRLRDADVIQRLGDAAGAGTYAMSYRITSTDGHAITGSVRFSLAGSGSDDEGQPAEDGGSAGQPTPADETAPVTAADDSGGIGAVPLVLLLAVLAIGLAGLAVGTRRALKHSVAMVDDSKNKRGRSRRK